MHATTTMTPSPNDKWTGNHLSFPNASLCWSTHQSFVTNPWKCIVCKVVPCAKNTTWFELVSKPSVGFPAQPRYKCIILNFSKTCKRRKRSTSPPWQFLNTYDEATILFFGHVKDLDKQWQCGDFKGTFLSWRNCSQGIPWQSCGLCGRTEFPWQGFKMPVWFYLEQGHILIQPIQQSFIPVGQWCPKERRWDRPSLSRVLWMLSGHWQLRRHSSPHTTPHLLEPFALQVCRTRTAEGGTEARRCCHRPHISSPHSLVRPPVARRELPPGPQFSPCNTSEYAKSKIIKGYCRAVGYIDSLKKCESGIKQKMLRQFFLDTMSFATEYTSSTSSAPYEHLWWCILRATPAGADRRVLRTAAFWASVLSSIYLDAGINKYLSCCQGTHFHASYRNTWNSNTRCTRTNMCARSNIPTAHARLLILGFHPRL